MRSDRVRIKDAVNRSREAAALLTGAVASVSQLPDAEVRQLAQGTLETVSRLQARLQLLDEAYGIAERHLATVRAPLLRRPGVAEPTPLAPSAARGALATGGTYFLDGS